MATAAAYLFALAAGAFLGRFELHSDDTGVEVAILLAACFVLGWLHPRHAWQWAVIVGLWIPAAELAFRRPPVNASSLLVAAFVLGIGLAGSYMGVLVSGRAGR
ncbi:MAG TPA: hypothetical protein VH640_31280 [Bryobacteraceae bacterium]|jgi:hypothetical protein